MKPSEVKKEYQLQQWAGCVKEQKESGLTIRQWCSEQGISEHAYYYRLHKVRQSMCNVLEQAPVSQLAEIPLSAPSGKGANLHIALSKGTVDITGAGLDVVERVLRVLSHAE